jgi:seryl-tRNA synthetase
MIDIKSLESQEKDANSGLTFLEQYQKTLEARGEKASVIETVLNLNAERKSMQAEAEALKAKQNKVGQEIAKIKKAKGDASALLQEMQEVSKQQKDLEHKASDKKGELDAVLVRMPNICHHSVPVGKGEEDNKEVAAWGEPKELPFEAKEHWDLGEKLGVLDFERAGKVTGARFSFLKGNAARLERALIQFFMDVHSRDHGYEEMIPPFIVNNHSLFGTSQFPKFESDVFHVESSQSAEHDRSGDEGVTYHLIPTAEVPVTNYYAGEILNNDDLPKCYVAYSPCFRSEAGSYGKDTKGLIRQHQFNKVELVKFTRPEDSMEELEKLRNDAENILQLLELPYRVMSLCTGDISFGAAKCYDLEVWLPGQKKFREISSCSNFLDFQSRRANIRFRREVKGKPEFVHTLNGSGLAVGRTLVAIFENYQQEDGSIEIPQVLRPYMMGATKVTRS